MKLKTFFILMVILFATKNLQAEDALLEDSSVAQEGPDTKIDLAVLERLPNPFKSKIPEVKVVTPPQIENQPKTPNFYSQMEAVNKGIQKIEPQVKLPDMTVEGIIWKTDHPQVIINQGVYSLGDVFNNIKIKKIEKNTVVVEYLEKEFMINF